MNINLNIETIPVGKMELLYTADIEVNDVRVKIDLIHSDIELLKQRVSEHVQYAVAIKHPTGGLLFYPTPRNSTQLSNGTNSRTYIHTDLLLADSEYNSLQSLLVIIVANLLASGHVDIVESLWSTGVVRMAFGTRIVVADLHRTTDTQHKLFYSLSPWSIEHRRTIVVKTLDDRRRMTTLLV